MQAQLSLLRGEGDEDGADRTETTATPGDAAGGARGAPKELGVGKQAAPYAHPYYWAPFILIGNWK